MSAGFLAEVSLAADPKLLRAARLVVSALAADRGLSVDDIEDLKLAVQEACANRLMLGLAKERINIQVQATRSDLTIQISGDQAGPGHGDDEADLGIALAEALVDEVSIQDTGGAERVVLRKALPQQQ